MASAAQISRQLEKRMAGVLGPHGFVRFEPRSLVRVRVPFLDVVSVQLGPAAESFQLHQHVHLLANRAELSLNAYRVGSRLLRDPISDVEWVVTDERPIGSVLDSIECTIGSCSLEFFGRVSDLRDYVLEVACDTNPAARLHQFDLALALAALGRRDRVLQLCEEMKHAVRTREGLTPSNVALWIDCADLLSGAVRNARVNELIDEWSRSRLAALGG
jgi:hypothetical protein